MRFLLLVLLLVVACGDDTAPPDGGLDAAGDAAPDADADAAPSCTHVVGPPEALPEPQIHTPRWAFEPWISKDISDRDDSFAFVDGFISRDIPVGVLVLDSPWETQYNTFVPNPSRYPDFPDMVAQLDERGVRIVLWVTQMVNNSSYDLEEGGDVYSGPAPNFLEGLACGYYVDDGRTWGWWKGEGAGVDFFDEGARQWWHAQQDALIDAGLDGWKLDFGENYIRRDRLATAEGEKSHQEYSEAYYRDYYAYGQSRAGRDFITMVRPWDQSYDFEGRFYARPEHAPVAWVGDNHRDWTGIVDALDEILRSAVAGYVVLGSDLGGYLDRDELDILRIIPFDLEVFQRWTALAALTPFMQLHGRANLEPWAIDDPSGLTLDNYRYWAKLHSALVPFFYSLAEEAYAGGEVIIRPFGTTPTDWADDFRFMLGDAFLVAPVIAAGDARDIALPTGEWYDWWDPSGDAIAGGTTLTAYDLSERGRVGLFVAAGAIVPMHVVDDANGLGSDASAGALTVLVWPSATATRFVLHDDDEMETEITAAADTVTIARALAPVLFRIRTGAMPASVDVGGASASEVADRAALDGRADGWFYEASSRSIWVKVPATDASTTITWTMP